MEFVESVVHWKTSTFLIQQQRVKRKGGTRWISQDKSRYFTWDWSHGEIEVFNSRGLQIAILNADGTVSSKEFEIGRRIDV
jgi:hypothetical protein